MQDQRGPRHNLSPLPSNIEDLIRYGGRGISGSSSESKSVDLTTEFNDWGDITNGGGETGLPTTSQQFGHIRQWAGTTVNCGLGPNGQC